MNVNEDYWRNVLAAQSQHRRSPCVGDLLRSRSVVVRAYVQMWTTGALTFEQMAAGLVGELVEQNDRLTREVVLLSQSTNTPFAVKKDVP